MRSTHHITPLRFGEPIFKTSSSPDIPKRRDPDNAHELRKTVSRTPKLFLHGPRASVGANDEETNDFNDDPKGVGKNVGY